MTEIKAKNFSPVNILQNQKTEAPSNTKAKLDSRDPKQLEAAKMFENQFIRQMIREMRKTVPGDGLVEDSMATKVFKEQLDDQYADKWVESGGIGLSDVIYQQLQQKYGPKPSNQEIKKPGELMPLKPLASTHQQKNSGPIDIIPQREKDLFLLKKTVQGLQIKSKVALPEGVQLRSPLNGEVIHSVKLGEGKQLLVIKHDLGLGSDGQNSSLLSQFVHTGKNLVEIGDKIIQGQAVAMLPAANHEEERAHVVFGLRKGSAVE